MTSSDTEKVYAYGPSKRFGFSMCFLCLGLLVATFWALITNMDIELVRGQPVGPVASKLLLTVNLVFMLWLLWVSVLTLLWSYKGGSILVLRPDTIGVPTTLRTRDLIETSYSDIHWLKKTKAGFGEQLSASNEAGWEHFRLFSSHFASRDQYLDCLAQLESRTGLTASP